MKKVIICILFLCFLSIPCFMTKGLELSTDHKRITVSSKSAMLATNLGVSRAAADKVMNIIDTYGDVAMVISLIGVVVGVGGITAGVIAIARRLAMKHGKAYAAAW